MARRLHSAPLTGPDWLTLARIPLAGGLVALAAHAALPRSLWCGLLVAVAATDIADGAWARAAATASARGAAWDTRADAVAAIAVAASLALATSWHLPARVWFAIVGVAAARILVIAVTWRRFGRASMTHTWANKAAGVTLMAVAGVAMATGRMEGWLAAVGCAVVGAAVADEALYVCRAGDDDPDAAGAWKARRRGRAPDALAAALVPATTRRRHPFPRRGSRHR